MGSRLAVKAYLGKDATEADRLALRQVIVDATNDHLPGLDVTVVDDEFVVELPEE